MSTARFATIEMPPFLQSFLRGYYECDELIFSFPRASRKVWLPAAFQETLWYPPKNYNPKTDCTHIKHPFHIEIPDMNTKDPDSQNYVSARANLEFINQVKDFYYAEAYREFDALRAVKYKGPSCVSIFMDRYNIPIIHEDAIKRDYSRYQNYVYNKNFRKKPKKIST